ncbi:hypothetical protein [Sphingomonas aerophila]|uniref:Uncharacterized protein n=1 Tax=Sphingomonas aerophila TaxID=1344948 RepID=A0A7W9EVR6_9SPHN|nr:hypothetical protein [Sphingomonas aerophila]MBB5714758.1 hypothetical protein [Sphingomonas aerophila]
MLDAFSELGLIDAGAVTAWSRRQYESDSSTERARRSRAKKKAGNADATLRERCATAPETEADTETDHSVADATGTVVPHPATDFCKAVFDSGRAILTRSGMDPRQAGSLLGRWRKSLGDPELLTLIRQSEAEGHSDPAAWLSAAVETRNGKHRPYRQPANRSADGFTSALRRASAKLEAGNLG